VQVARSAKLFFRGPARAVSTALSALLAIVAFAELVSGASAARVLTFVCAALLALVVVAFLAFHNTQIESRRRDTELPSAIERLLQKGMDQLDAMVAAQKANPQRLGPWGEQEQEAWDFFYEARQLLIDHDKRSLLDDLAESTNEAHRREREKQRRPFEKLAEREEAGEKIGNAEKMKVWGEDLRRSSIGEMEAILSGVSKVAKHVQG
jgi:flagellar motor component MotA